MIKRLPSCPLVSTLSTAAMKNDHLGFTIPCTLGDERKQYIPDFLAHPDDGPGPADPLQLILQVSGQSNCKKEAKTSAAEGLWMPAAGQWGRWRFLAITDPRDAATTIHCARGAL